MADPEANEVCGMDHLCGGTESGIQWGIHVMQLLWKQQLQEEGLNFLLAQVSQWSTIFFQLLLPLSGVGVSL